MSIFEYDEEEVLALIRSDEREDGIAEGKTIGMLEGKIESILELLLDFGSLPKSLEQKIRAEQNPDVLSKWHKLAAKSDSIEQFTDAIDSDTLAN